MRAEWTVRKRSQYGQTLHRTEPDADEPRPACQQSDVDYPDEYAGYLGFQYAECGRVTLAG